MKFIQVWEGDGEDHREPCWAIRLTGELGTTLWLGDQRWVMTHKDAVLMREEEASRTILRTHVPKGTFLSLIDVSVLTAT